jgi:translin
MSLKEILEKIQEELGEREQFRDEARRNMRKATRLSKQAIHFIHQDRFIAAENLLEEAQELFVKLRETAEEYPYIYYCGFVGGAFEENAEAHIFLTLIQQGKFPTPQEIGIPVTPYLLSLGDVIGELRRKALNLIRKGEIQESEKCLGWMEQIYSELISLDDAYIIVSGLRRKTDVARRLIEITRGDITIEVRRNELENTISKLHKHLKKMGNNIKH